MSKNNDMGFFSISIAEKYGLTCAVIYQSIRYWIDYNQANKKNFRDGCYWVYNSVSAWHELFPYLTEKQIRTAIEELEADNLIVSSNHNKRKYDRTKWYTIPEKSKIHLPCGANGVALQGEPIPLITTETTNDIPNNSLELFGEAENNSDSQKEKGESGKEKEKLPGFQPMFNILAETCKLDVKLMRGKIAGISKSLIKAGYEADDIKMFSDWWNKNDWRGEKGQPPTLGIVTSMIKQAKETSGGEKSKPVEPKYDYEPYKNENGEIKLKRILIS